MNLTVCPKHPKYQGKLAPRANCAHCWVLYMVRRQQQHNAAMEMAIENILFILRGEL